MVALDVAAARALPGAARAVGEDLDDRAGEGSRLGVAVGLPPPAEEGRLILEGGVAAEETAEGRQRVEVEDDQPAGPEVALEALEGGQQLVVLEDVVERVVDAGDQVELA